MSSVFYAAPQVRSGAADGTGCKKVIGVEIVEEAKTEKQNGLENCEFIAGDVLKVLDGKEEKPDFISRPSRLYIPSCFS